MYEADVLDLVAIDQWPQRADASLRAHVAGCAVCAEVASIAIAVREWSETESVPRMQDSSVVWHRAQVKARAEAARAASKPVWVAQAFALVSLVVALVWFGPSESWYASSWQAVSKAAPLWPASLGANALPPGWGWTLSLALGGVVLLVSLVLGAIRISERSEIPHNR